MFDAEVRYLSENDVFKEYITDCFVLFLKDGKSKDDDQWTAKPCASHNPHGWHLCLSIKAPYDGMGFRVFSGSLVSCKAHLDLR